MCGNNSCESLTETLCMIVKLQKQGECFDSSNTACNKPFLGNNTGSALNTRPIRFYTCPNNSLWTMPYTLNGVTGNSSIFRVEAVEDCCCTCRVLAENDTTLEATDSFFTINLNCVGALQCLEDTYIACI